MQRYKTKEIIISVLLGFMMELANQYLVNFSGNSGF